MTMENKLYLVTGGTGAMGSILVHRLISSGKRVRVLTLPGDPCVSRLKDIDVEIRYGDISKPEDLKRICEDVHTVLHLAAVIISNDESVFDRINIEGTRNLLHEAKLSSVSHFIHVSSASVVYPRVTPYSLSKRVAERFVKESKVPWTIIRPTLVYGKSGGLEFDMFLDYLDRFPIIPFIGNGTALKRPVYVEDIIDGFIKLIDSGRGLGKIYNFSGRNNISIINFARLCLVLLNKPDKKIIHIPTFIYMILAFFLKKVMKNPPLKWNVIAGVIQDADLDPREAIEDLQYNPSSVMERLPECFPRKRVRK